MKPSEIIPDIISSTIAELLSAALSRLPKSLKTQNCRNWFLAGVLAVGLFGVNSVYAAITPAPTQGNSVVVSGTESARIGTGNGWNGNTVTVGNGTASTVWTVANNNAVSLGNNAAVTVKTNADVSNKATSSGGGWGAGCNTIEFYSNGTLIVESGGSVRSTGTSTNAEAVNVMGYGNKILNYGTISALNASAIWFEDKTNGTENLIDNYGTIQAGNGSTPRNVIGNSGSSAVHFINETGAIVYGSLKFAGGNDILELNPGSVITGGFDGGAGTNTLTLNGTAGSSDKLSGSISNFSTLTKQGDGQWILTGSIGNTNGKNLAVDVREGTLTLTGDNTKFNGTVTVDANGTLEARAQSLPSAVTDNGIVRFVQTDAGTYSGIISGTGSVEKVDAGRLELTGNNTYAGGTNIYGGIVAVGKDAALGSANSGILLDGGTLEITNNFLLNPQHTISLGNNGGGIKVNDGITMVPIRSVLSGSGSFTKSGSGQLTLSGENTYTGNTTVSGGQLVIGAGTVGSIIGNVDITDTNARLIFNRSNEYQFDGTISGSGGVGQTGSGTTILTGSNIYTGNTTVSNGTLFVNGNQSGATGTTLVDSGARLSGSGTIGGDVVVNSGAMLAPGNQQLHPGVMNINGNLTLNSGSEIFYNLEDPSIEGGLLNDFVNVGGALNIDGATINILDQGQSFLPGVYRVFNYGGNLLDSNLIIGDLLDENHNKTGDLPAGLEVQTSVAGQVNLVNTGGQQFNFWDVGSANDSIDGGTGVWHNSGTDTRWTKSDGSVNADWQDSAFAIFGGTAGTVAVDDTPQVKTSGMQFLTDGYQIRGRDLELVSNGGQPAYIRVQNGVTATVDSVLKGDVVLEKSDAGTLVLTAPSGNTYTGGTVIGGGTLQISADNHLGAGGSKLTLDGGTLRNTAAFLTARQVEIKNGGGTFDTGANDTGDDLIIAGNITGNGKLSKTGDSNLHLQGANTYSGNTEIISGAGSIYVEAGGSITGNVKTIAGTSLVYNVNNETVYGGIVSGEGNFAQLGTAKVILTGNSTYTGETSIADGAVLQVGNGTTGIISGTSDIETNSTGIIIFNRSNNITVDSTISGSGTFVQNGTGNLTLTKDSTFNGEAQVNTGTLSVNADFGDAKVDVKSGARLSGNGTVGTTVVNTGAMLAPGSAPFAADTLTVNTSLTMESGSVLYYNLMEPNIAGGQNNDFVDVNGDLVLNGTTLHIYDQNQDFLPGVYRIFNYSGGLTQTNGGMSIGTLWDAPSSESARSGNGLLDDFFVQTSIQGQVNLVNTSGLTLTFWDADDTIPDNGIISGGSGTWQNTNTTQLWTDANGDTNAGWTDSGFAIFTATPGTVTIDNSSFGQVKTSGMQFMTGDAGTAGTDYYLITGDKLELVNGTSGTAVVRVGADASLGSNIVAEIKAELTGGAVLEKSDAGTLILSGTNTYGGGTVVSGGTLSISDDNNLGAAGTDLTLNGGTLQNTAAITTNRNVSLGDKGGTFETQDNLTLQNSIDGTGTLTKTGSESLILEGTNTYTGGTKISNGDVVLKDAGTIIGNVELDENTKTGTLVFKRNSGHKFDGIISGDGTVAQIGTGTTILTGENTYEGTTSLEGGALQVGDGSTSGTLGQSSIIFNAESTLSFNRSDVYEFTGKITDNSGVGAISQDGDGTTIISGDNGNFKGKVEVNNGTLQVGNYSGGSANISSISNAQSVKIAEGANLAFDMNVAGTTNEEFGVKISGKGNFIQKNGATTFTAENDYTGTTTIGKTGILQIGNGTDGWIASTAPVSNSGVLIFNRSDDKLFDAVINGGGSLFKDGAGKLNLTANSTYTGGTFIEDGILQLGDDTTIGGSSTGGIIGDITIEDANSDLIVNRNNLIILDGVISGEGGIVQNGSGWTVLTGNNNYNGDTVVKNGALYINGNQEGSASKFTVNNDVTLGGTGTIGTGTVTIESGGILNPGDVSSAPGTLTMSGALLLQDGAVLDYNFGQADVIGGPFNDLTIVKGDLTLNGKINVTSSDGGKFDPGVYRVITYDGTLTDNTLEIGELPTEQILAHWSVQTNIANEVNLITTQGLSLNFWDGGGTPDNDKVEGGTQVWNVNPDDEKWTNSIGDFNGEWTQAGFGIFMAAPGTVTVSNDYSNVKTSGMQFAVNGYKIIGDDLTLVNGTASGTAIVRVGDGSSLGSGYTTEISANLIGDAVLEKTDLGTLKLTGTNNYAGGTKVRGGTLVGNIPVHSNLTIEKGATYDGDNAARSVASLNGGGTVSNTNGLSIDDGNFAGNIDDSNSGTITKTTDGTLTLTGENTFDKTFEIAQGTLNLSGEGTITNADLVMKKGTTFDIAGATSIEENTPAVRTVHSLSVTKDTTIALGSNDFNLDGKDVFFNIEDTVHNNDVISTTTGNGSVSINDSTIHLNAAQGTWTIGDTLILLQNNVLTPDSLNVIAPSRFTATAELTFWVGVREDDLIATWGAVNLDHRTPSILEPNLVSLAMVNQGQDWMHNVGFTLLNTSRDKVRSAAPCKRALSLKNGWLAFGGFEGGSSRYQTGGSFDLDSYHVHAGLGKKRNNSLGKLSFGGIFQAGFGNYSTVDSFTGYAPVRGNGDSDYYGGLLFAKQFIGNNNYVSALVNFGNTDTDYETYGLPQPVSFSKTTPYFGTSVAAGHLWKLRKHITADTFVRYLYNEVKSDNVTLLGGDPLHFGTASSNRLQLGTRFSFSPGTLRRGKSLQFYAGGIYEYEFSGRASGTSFGLPIESRELSGGTGIGELGANYARGAWTTDFSVRGYTGMREGISIYAGLGYKF